MREIMGNLREKVRVARRLRVMMRIIGEIMRNLRDTVEIVSILNGIIVRIEGTPSILDPTGS
jgi:hypothetical protein